MVLNWKCHQQRIYKGGKLKGFDAEQISIIMNAINNSLYLRSGFAVVGVSMLVQICH